MRERGRRGRGKGKGGEGGRGKGKGGGGGREGGRRERCFALKRIPIFLPSLVT